MKLNHLELQFATTGNGSIEKFYFFIDLLRLKYITLCFDEKKHYRCLIKGNEVNRKQFITDMITKYDGNLEYKIHKNYIQDGLTFDKEYFILSIH